VDIRFVDVRSREIKERLKKAIREARGGQSDGFGRNRPEKLDPIETAGDNPTPTLVR
jgi:hypothetical protein